MTTDGSVHKSLEAIEVLPEDSQKKNFFLRHKWITAFVVLVGLIVIGEIYTYYSTRSDVLDAEKEMALYIINEAKLAEGEEIESITFDVVAEKCDSYAVCGAYAHKTEIYIKSTQREWTIKAGSYPDEHWYLLGAYDICIGGETTDDELCFNRHAEDVHNSVWEKTLDDITVNYDKDFPIG